MSNLIQNTTDFAMFIASGYIKEGDVLIDATCGNGYDTLSLAKMHPVKLYAFDKQQQAIDNTRNRLISNGFEKELQNETIKLICDSHENICSHVSQPVNAAVFNLGYLPGGDKSITTCQNSTLAAVNAVLDMLAQNGLLCITMYSGHNEGRTEKQSLLSFASELDSHKYHTAYISITNQKNAPPEILLITKKI